MRKTHASVQTALALMADPDARHWGYDLVKRANVRSGVLYPVLDRMLTEGWLKDRWEHPTELQTRRPPRRYYEVTEQGRKALAELLDEAQNDPRFSALLGKRDEEGPQ